MAHPTRAIAQAHRAATKDRTLSVFLLKAQLAAADQRCVEAAGLSLELDWEFKKLTKRIFENDAQWREANADRLRLQREFKAQQRVAS